MISHESRNICELRTVEESSAFIVFLSRSPSGIEIVAEKYGGGQILVLKSDAGPFAKWLRANNPGLIVAFDETAPKIVLRSAEIWLPLVFLASDIALPIYLNLVASYLHDRMKGSLKNESTRVHFCAEFEDKISGKVKRFTFEGDGDSLKTAIKRFDLNEFLNE